MSSPTIDYDALAQQHGGTAAVDYDALAAQHGGSVASVPQQHSALDPKGGWNPMDLVRGAVSGVKNMIAHPLDTAASMAQPFLASGMAPGGMYPTIAATGRPQDSAANAQVQREAQQGQIAAAKSIAQNPAYTVGTVVGPAALTMGAAKLAPKVAPVLAGASDALAEHLYGNALKPPPGSVTAAERSAQIRTGLENSIPVSPAGVEKLGSLIDDLNNKIAAEIASDPNRPINPNRVATRTAQTKQQFSDQVVAGPDLAAIEDTRQQFLAERGAKPGKPAVPPQPTGVLDAQGNPIMTGGKPATPPQPAPNMPAEQAQAMKQGTYNILRKKYGEQGSATVEAQKALARGLKEEIATQFPEIDNLNAAESKLLDLGPVLERAVNRISNNHTIGIGGPILSGAVKAATNSTGAAAAVGIVKSVVDIPAVKSRLAIALSKGAKVPYSQALSRVNAYAASLGSAAAGSQAYSSGESPTQ